MSSFISTVSNSISLLKPFDEQVEECQWYVFIQLVAEVPAGKLVEAHGTFSTASCTRCQKSYDGEQIKV